MARIQIYRVQFLDGNGQSAVAGDVLDIFCETDDIVTPKPPVFSPTAVEGIEVELNGSPLISDDTYSWLGMGQNRVTVQNFNQQFCESTSLVAFFDYPAQWPYASYYTLANWPACGFVPHVCDLMVVGIPTVQPASSETTADGAITVVASSTLPIEYKLSSDFVYGDGTAQSDGIFSGLLPGQHRIYLRDSANCQSNVLVTVGIDNTYSTRFRLEYDDLNGNVSRVDITKRAYAGAVDEVCGYDRVPLDIQMTLAGVEDKFYPIAALAATICLNSDTDSKFIELFTNDPNLYRAVFYKDFGSGFERLWTGKVLKQQYQEDFKFPPYKATFKASCGLTDLKDYYLIQDDGQKYTGETKAISLIAHCLSVCKIELPIRVAINLYALEMDSTASDDPLDQAYIDFERFYLATNEPTLDYVLKAILESFGARIVQWEDHWNITRVEEMVDDYDYRVFDKDGVYVSNGTYQPVKELGFPAQALDAIFVDANQNLEIRPSYGILKIKYGLGLKPNILRNGDFRLKSQYYNIGTSQGYALSINKDGFTLVNAGYSIEETYEQIDNNNVAYKLVSYILDAFASGNGGEAYVVTEPLEILMGTNNTLRINFRYKISSSSTFINLFVLQYFKVNVPYTKVRAQITFDDGTDVYYLTADGRWTDQANEIFFFITEVDQYVESEVVAVQPPGGSVGGIFQIRFYTPFPYYTQFDNLVDLRAFETYNGTDRTLPNGYRTEMAIEVIVGPGTFHDLYYYELRETTDPENLDGYNVIEPDDYDVTDNPRKWVRVGYASTGDVSINNPKLTFTTCIDRMKVTFLTDGKEPTTTVIRSAPGEGGNREVFEKELILGSYSSLITTDVNFGIDLGLFYPNAGGLTAVTTNILLAYLIYTGYYRDADGVGYELWARDGITESDKLHGITLKELTAQYKKSSRLMRGSFKAKSSFFGFLNVLKNVNDSDRIYLPMGLSLDDKACKYSGEMIELKNIFDPAESSSGSAFTRAFNQVQVD